MKSGTHKLKEIGMGMLTEIVTGYKQAQKPTKPFVMVRYDEHSFRIIKTANLTNELDGYVFFREVSAELEEWVKDVGVI